MHTVLKSPEGSERGNISHGLTMTWGKTKRRCERRFRKSKLYSDCQMYLEQKINTDKVIEEAKADYYKGQLEGVDAKTIFAPGMIFSVGTHALFQMVMIQRYCLRSSLNSSSTIFKRSVLSLILPKMKQRLWMTLMSYNYIPPQLLSSVFSMKCRLKRFQSWLAVAPTKLVHWSQYQLGFWNHVWQLFYNHWLALWILHFHLDIFLKLFVKPW